MPIARQTEVLIVGAGVMGASIALECARRGRQVTVLERFEPGNTRGSSHGPSRIFRLSYPDPGFVKMARESLTDWARIERDVAEPLLARCGGLDLGPEADQCAAAMEQAGVSSQWMSRDEVAKEFGLAINGDRALYQKDASIINCRTTVEGQLALARAVGADVRFGVRVASLLRRNDESVEVVTSDGVIVASHTVLAAGPWTAPLAASFGLDIPVSVTLEFVGYFTPAPRDIPVVIDRSKPEFYMVPAHFASPGLKSGIHGGGMVVDPEDGPFETRSARMTPSVEWLSSLLGGPVDMVGVDACLYTNTASSEFIVGSMEGLIVVSACSGHGFKFAPRIGRAVADMIDGKPSDLPEAQGALTP